MGAIHTRFDTVEHIALHGGVADGGTLVAVDPQGSTVELLADERLTRALPERPGWLARQWFRFRPPVAPPPEVRRFAVSPPPVAPDAHSHPVFLRVAGEVPLSMLRPGERVWVIGGVGCTGVLRDDEATGARVRAAFDRTADLAWAEAAGSGALHDALLERERADVALEELGRRRALDLDAFAARLPISALPTLFALARPDPGTRRRLIAAAARRLAQPGDRPALYALIRALFDRTGLEDLLPLLLLVDPADPAAAEVVHFARVRLERTVRDEPARAPVFAPALARFGAP